MCRENVCHWSTNKTRILAVKALETMTTTMTMMMMMMMMTMTVYDNNNDNNNNNIILATAVIAKDKEKSSKLHILHGLFNNTLSGLDCRMKL